MMQSLTSMFELLDKQGILLLAPELLVLVTIIGVTLMLTFGKDEAEREKNTWLFSCVGAVSALVFLGVLYVMFYQSDRNATIGLLSGLPYEGINQLTGAVFYNMFQADLFSVIIRATLVVGTLFVLAFSREHIKRNAEASGEFYLVLLTGLFGGMLLSGARDLIMIFVSLETLSIASYIMVGFFRTDARSIEASLKYLLYGGAATALVLFGFSLLYGLSGSTNLVEISAYLQGADPHYILVSVLTVLMIGGFAFKLSAAPFHMWAPDVYHGAPTPVTAFLSVVSKVAAFALVIRVLFLLYPSLDAFQAAGATDTTRSLYLGLLALLATISVISMIVGNTAALVQTNIKRLLAYSTIAHAGYMLLGLMVMSQASLASVVYYLVTYLFMNLGAFAVVVYFSQLTGRDDIQAYAGLVRKRPTLALVFTIFLISLSGLPITAGFFGKFFVFQSVAQASGGYVWLVMIALLTSTVSLYYYLNIVRLMVISEPSDAVEALSPEPPFSFASLTPTGATVTVCVLATLALGILAEPVMQCANTSIAELQHMRIRSMSTQQRSVKLDSRQRHREGLDHGGLAQLNAGPASRVLATR